MAGRGPIRRGSTSTCSSVHEPARDRRSTPRSSRATCSRPAPPRARGRRLTGDHRPLRVRARSRRRRAGPRGRGATAAVRPAHRRVEPLLATAADPTPIHALLERVQRPVQGVRSSSRSSASPFRRLRIRADLRARLAACSRPRRVRGVPRAYLRLQRLTVQIAFYRSLKGLLGGWRLFHALAGRVPGAHHDRPHRSVALPRLRAAPMVTAALGLSRRAPPSSPPLRPAAADVFSPGDLSRAHASALGPRELHEVPPRAASSCSRQRCLELPPGARAAPRARAGFHGRLAGRTATAGPATTSTRGRDFALVDWGPGGARSLRSRAHRRRRSPASTPRPRCETCHDPRLVADPAVKALLAKQPQPHLPRRPGHGRLRDLPLRRAPRPARERLPPLPLRARWKPAPGSITRRPTYPLTGKHAQVACAKCHASVPDSHRREPPGVVTAPVSPDRFVALQAARERQLPRLPQGPARGPLRPDLRSLPRDRRLAADLPAGATAERAFHDRTRYPLTGAHPDVELRRLPRPVPRQPARFKPIAFQACTDCHVDAHARPAGAPRRGRRRLRSLPRRARLPARRGSGSRSTRRRATRSRARTAWSPASPATRPTSDSRTGSRRVPRRAATPRPPGADLPGGLRHRRRPRALRDLPRRSRTRGQLARPEGCAGCHGLESFQRSASITRRQPLRAGRQARRRSPAPPVTGRARRGRRGGPLPSARRSLAPAATRPAPGQLTLAAQPAASRHGLRTLPRRRELEDRPRSGTSSPSRLTRSPGSTEGRLRAVPPARWRWHQGVACRRYKPLPRDCEGCHADFHQGAFRGFDPGGEMRRTRSQHSRGACPASGRSPGGPSGCSPTCARSRHIPPIPTARSATPPTAGATWPSRTSAPASLSAARTREPRASPATPTSFTTRLGRDCALLPPRRPPGRLGRALLRLPRRDGLEDALRRRRPPARELPLTGRHAFIPCQECHGDRRDRGFARTTPECLACHQQDYDRTSHGRR